MEHRFNVPFFTLVSVVVLAMTIPVPAKSAAVEAILVNESYQESDYIAENTYLNAANSSAPIFVTPCPVSGNARALETNIRVQVAFSADSGLEGNYSVPIDEEHNCTSTPYSFTKNLAGILSGSPDTHWLYFMVSTTAPGYPDYAKAYVRVDVVDPTLESAAAQVVSGDTVIGSQTLDGSKSNPFTVDSAMEGDLRILINASEQLSYAHLNLPGVYDGAMELLSGTQWYADITKQDLPDGSHTLTLNFRDIAGNAGVQSYQIDFANVYDTHFTLVDDYGRIQCKAKDIYIAYSGRNVYEIDDALCFPQIEGFASPAEAEDFEFYGGDKTRAGSEMRYYHSDRGQRNKCGGRSPVHAGRREFSRTKASG